MIIITAKGTESLWSGLKCIYHTIQCYIIRFNQLGIQNILKKKSVSVLNVYRGLNIQYDNYLHDIHIIYQLLRVDWRWSKYTRGLYRSACKHCATFYKRLTILLQLLIPIDLLQEGAEGQLRVSVYVWFFLKENILNDNEGYMEKLYGNLFYKLIKTVIWNKMFDRGILHRWILLFPVATGYWTKLPVQSVGYLLTSG